MRRLAVLFMFGAGALVYGCCCAAWANAPKADAGDATNSHVFRNRAPIFMSRFYPAAGGLVRETERVLVPELGARLGNFCVAHEGREAWLVVAEWMQPKGGERFGSDNSIWLVKVAFPRRD